MKRIWVAGTYGGYVRIGPNQSEVKRNAVKVPQSKLVHPKIVHCSKMALIGIGKIQLDLGQSKQWFWQSLELLNLDWGSDLNDEQFLDDLILDHIWNSLSSFPFR